MKIHSGLKPFVCSWCKRNFKRKEDLKLHLVREGHINFGKRQIDEGGAIVEKELNKYIDKLLACEFCDKLFDRPSAFKNHLRVHINEMAEETDTDNVADVDEVHGNQSAIEMTNEKHTINEDGSFDKDPKGVAISCSSEENSLENKSLEEDGHGNANDESSQQSDTKPLTGLKELDKSSKHEMSDEQLKTETVSRLKGSDSIKPYKCPFCQFACHQPSKFKEHERTHTGERPYKCDQCSKCFTLDRTLKQHRKIHSGEKPHQCEICLKSFVNKSQLVTHEFQHTGVSRFKCHLCQSSFSTKAGLGRHMNFHLGKRDHVCDKCGKAFFAKSELTGHIRFHHKKRIYAHKCEICEKPFVSRGDLNKHMTVHSDERPYMCSSCGKGFSRKTYLTKHMIVHTSDKPYKCTTCNKAFSFVSNLTTHERIHTGEKPYACQYCGKRSSDVANHIKHMKIHNKDKNTSQVDTASIDLGLLSDSSNITS